MTQTNLFDPFDYWKQFYNRAEEYYNNILDETMKSNEFSSWMGQYLNMYLLHHEALQKSYEFYLGNINIPLKTDLSNLASLVINLENKVDQMDRMYETQLVHHLNNVASSKEINNIKVQLEEIHKRLADLLPKADQI